MFFQELLLLLMSSVLVFVLYKAVINPFYIFKDLRAHVKHAFCPEICSYIYRRLGTVFPYNIDPFIDNFGNTETSVTSLTYQNWNT